MTKSETALRTMKEVSEILNLKPHVLRFWEDSFDFLKPVKYNKHRYYSSKDIKQLQRIKTLLYVEEYSIKEAYKILSSETKKNNKPHILYQVLTKLELAKKRLELLLET